MADQVKYKVVEGWEQLPKGFAHRDVAGVAVDQEDRVFLICRGENPVIVYDRQGNFLRTWGKGDFSMRTHGIYVAPNGTIFATDDGNHTVRQFTPEGRLLMTMGTLNVPSDTGYDGKTTGSIKLAGPPFNRPTNVAIGPRGDIYISDGYGNARVHIFSPSGQLKRSWGTAPASSGCRTASAPKAEESQWCQVHRFSTKFGSGGRYIGQRRPRSGRVAWIALVIRSAALLSDRPSALRRCQVQKSRANRMSVRFAPRLPEPAASVSLR
jgi:NHL repeat